MTKAKVNGSELRISERDELVSGSGNANRLGLCFSPDWNGLVKQIDFINRKSGVSRRISADDAECTVPWEVLDACGEVDCCLRGLDSEGKLVKRTNEENLGAVISEYDGEVAEAAAATPDAIDALSAAVHALEQPISVSFSSDSEGNITADKSFIQLMSEVSRGKTVLTDNTGRCFHLVEKTDDKLQFICIDEQPYIYDLRVNSDNSWHFAMDMLLMQSMLEGYVSNKLNKYLGAEHAGEVLVVGADGIITTRAM